MTQTEINNKIEALKRLVANPTTPQSIKDNAKAKMEDLLATTPTEEMPKKKSEKKVAKTTPSGESTVDAMLATLRALMMSNQGSGVDSAEVRTIIENYLNTRKINLSELDSSVLNEIKKNQTTVITIPNYGLKISMDKNTANIPNIYSIIDDVLAGNNVYLIGEAGGGKTYSAEKVASILNREFSILNCSQYTSPVEILGGQTIEGYKDGKLTMAWKDGKILIMDEMPKLDPNTAGLFNDALAKSSKTREDAYINSTNPSEPPIPRGDGFAVIATGNVYPNKPNPAGYVGNNQQDLSLLDRFSGSVYFVDFSDYIDQVSCRYQFLYDMLVGNYHEYTKAKRDGLPLPKPRGLRTIIEANNMKNMALVSYRTITAFRVAFEIELVRAIAKSNGTDVVDKGKTVSRTLESYLVAFPEDAKNTLLKESDLTMAKVKTLSEDTISKILNDDFLATLTPEVRATSQDVFKTSTEFIIAENFLNS